MNFQQLRRLCLSLPDVEERETWGEATFRYRDKIFAMGSAEGGAVSIKASLDDQAALIEMDADTFAVSAYTGRYGWVTVHLDTVGPEIMRRLVTAAWKRTVPRRVSAQFEEVGAATSRKPAGASPRLRTSSRSEAVSPRPRTPRSSR